MASVKGENRKSTARKALDIALGDSRVRFGALTKKEQVDLLRKYLYSIDLRELRGFKPIRELLPFSDDQGSWIPDKLRNLSFEAKVAHKQEDFPEGVTVNLDTQAMILSRGPLAVSMQFRRHESNEETADWQVARDWGKSAYLYSGARLFLALRRPRNHAGADDCLFLVKCQYTKVPQKNEHLIHAMEYIHLPIDRLDEILGKKYYERVVVELVWEIRTALGRTVNSLEAATKRAREQEAKWDRLGDALTYPN